MEIGNFSSLNRSRFITTFKSETFDLLIIGGGVTGCGIALDAASRGLKVGLVEKKDFASGTSSKSTKLIHGGLRYLKQFDVGLVRETGQERAVLNRLAPHLALPEKMLLPIIENGTFGKGMASIGLWVYDFLAGVKGDDKRKMLSKKRALAEEPLLNEKILKGAGFYAEYRTDDARLTIELIKKAVSYGAKALNYTEVVDFIEGDKIQGVKVIDKSTNETYDIKAKKVVSAAGPWVDNLRNINGSLAGKRLHLTKGIHIVVPHKKLPLHHSIYFDVSDGRMIFAIPRGRVTYIGTTDTTYKSSLERIVATKADRLYLIEAVNSAFPSINLTPEDIESNWAGLRPLIHEDGKSPGELSRKDEVFVAENGLISIAGGKLTGYRKMAEKIVNLVCKQLRNEENRIFPNVSTKKIKLTSDAFQSNSEVVKYIENLSETISNEKVDDYYAWYLVTNYGKAGAAILEDIKQTDDAISEENLLKAEVRFCIENEMIETAEDFFVRRTGRLYFNIGSVQRHFENIIHYLGDKLNWDENRKKNEKQHMDILIQDATTYYDEEINVT